MLHEYKLVLDLICGITNIFKILSSHFVRGVKKRTRLNVLKLHYIFVRYNELENRVWTVHFPKFQREGKIKTV